MFLWNRDFVWLSIPLKLDDGVAKLQYPSLHNLRDVKFFSCIAGFLKDKHSALLWRHIDGLAQECCNSIASAMELLQSCVKPSRKAAITPGH